MYIDTHVHTSEHSPLKEATSSEVISKSKSLGIDGLVLAEDLSVWSSEEIAKHKDILLIPAQERVVSYNDRRVHLIIIGSESLANQPWDYKNLSWYRKFRLKGKINTPEIKTVIDYVHDTGGIVIAAHPMIKWGIGVEGMHELDFDAFETRGRGKEIEIARERNLPLVAGSDSSKLSGVGKYVTYFKDNVTDETCLIKAIREKKTVPMVYSNASYVSLI
jgi:hypothetical protein